MNWVDLVIVGVVVVLALLGLKLGILMPASGIGGLALGILLSVRYHGAVETILGEYISGDVTLKIAAYLSIVLVVAITTRLAASIAKKLLSFLVLGWVDHVSGAIAGAAAGLVLTGTASYLLIGAGLPQLRISLDESRLVVGISRISLISLSKPWCSRYFGTDDQAAEAELASDGEECTSLKTLAGRLAGERITGKFDGILGHDVDELTDGSASKLLEVASERLPEPPAQGELLEAVWPVGAVAEKAAGSEVFDSTK